MKSREGIWRRVIQPYIDGARRLAGTVHLAVICSTQGRTDPVSDYERQSIDSRFYSLKETEHFLGSLRGAGFLVKPFFNENDFFAWVMNGQHLTPKRQHLLVIATGSSFSGVGSKSLVPAFCRLHGLQVVGPDPHSACLARHKYHSNLVLRAFGEMAPATWCYDPQRGWIGSAVPPRGQAVILKLTHEGASIGIDEQSVVIADDSLTDKAALIARQFNQLVTVQEFLPGFEVEVPIFCTTRPQAIMPVGISLDGSERMDTRILTYEVTRADAYGFWDFERPVTREMGRAACQIAETCAEILGLRDLARIDFRIGSCGKPKVIDISTSPYISPHSSFGFVASTCGAAASDLPILLVGLACARIGLLNQPENALTDQDSSQICVSVNSNPRP